PSRPGRTKLPGVEKPAPERAPGEACSRTRPASRPSPSWRLSRTILVPGERLRELESGLSLPRRAERTATGDGAIRRLQKAMEKKRETTSLGRHIRPCT